MVELFDLVDVLDKLELLFEELVEERSEFFLEDGLFYDDDKTLFCGLNLDNAVNAEVALNSTDRLGFLDNSLESQVFDSVLIFEGIEYHE